MKITTKKSDGDVYVIVESDRLEPEGSYLQVKFTHEGMIFDHLTEDGNLFATFGTMYEEFVDKFQLQ
jgi:hypothetical protein